MRDLLARSTRIGGAILLLALLPLVGGATRAEHFEGTCGDSLDAVESAIVDAHFLGRNATSSQSNLLVRLNSAAAELDRGQMSDAVDKLQEISDLATAWTESNKPRLEDATAINEAVVDVMVCIKLL